MDKFRETPMFEVKEMTEQKPFKNEAVQLFFSKWCEANDSIVPEFVSRKSWEGMDRKDMWEEKSTGEKILRIPEDLELWEMVGVMEVVDRDTFSSQPEQGSAKAEDMRHLGKMFRDSAIYITQRLDAIKAGQDIAQGLAEEFFLYGQALMTGRQPNEQGTVSMLDQELSPEETEKVDQWLAGKTLYASRSKRVGKATESHPESREVIKEKERERTLAQFFRVAQTAFYLEQKSRKGQLTPADRSHLKAWQSDTPIHAAFLAKIKRKMEQHIEAPRQELGSAIFRRGLQKIVNEMREIRPRGVVSAFFKKIGIDLKREERRIMDILDIPRLKAELDAIGQKSHPAITSIKEKEIADRIQHAVNNFPFHNSANNPSEIVSDKYINCVGASIVGGALMKEAGLNYLVGNVPEHSILLLVTSDGRVEWRDMINRGSNGDLADEMIEGNEKSDRPITVDEIVEFSKHPSPEGLGFYLNGDTYREKLGFMKEKEGRYMSVFEPEYGQQIQVLNNIGAAFDESGQKKQAIEAYRQAIALRPKFAYPYVGLGNSLYGLNRDEEAVQAYRQAIIVNPKHYVPYTGLGNALGQLGRDQEAMEAYQKAIMLDPEPSYPYEGLGNILYRLGRYEEAVDTYLKATARHPRLIFVYNGLGNALVSLGQNKEAIKAYKNFIRFAGKGVDEYWITRAKDMIKGLEID